MALVAAVAAVAAAQSRVNSIHAALQSMQDIVLGLLVTATQIADEIAVMCGSDSEPGDGGIPIPDPEFE